MTIKEQIEQAAKEYATHYIDTKETDFYGKFIQEMGCNREEERAFIAGARWAVANPKSPWISIDDDLPCNHEELLINKGVTKKVFVLKFGGFPDVDYMLKVNGKWIWFAYENSKFWMPIPEPPKEQEIKL